MCRRSVEGRRGARGRCAHAPSPRHSRRAAPPRLAQAAAAAGARWAERLCSRASVEARGRRGSEKSSKPRASRRRSRDTKHRAPPEPARPSPNPPRALIMPQYCACRGAQGAHLNRSAAGRPVSGGPRAARSSPTTARRKHSGMLHAHGGRSGDEATACAGGARAPRQSRSNAPSPRRVGRCTTRTNAAAAAAGARWESDCAAGRAWTRERVARKNRRNERLA